MKDTVYRFPLKKLHKIFHVVDGMKTSDGDELSVVEHYELNGNKFYKFYENGNFIFIINRIDIKEYKLNYHSDQHTIIKYSLEFYKKTKNLKRYSPYGETNTGYRYTCEMTESQFDYIDRSLKLHSIL